MPVPHLCPPVAGKGADLLPIQKVFSGRRTVQTPQDVHERALAGTRCSHQGNVFPFLDIQRNALENRHIDLTEKIGLRDGFQFNETHFFFWFLLCGGVGRNGLAELPPAF